MANISNSNNSIIIVIVMLPVISHSTIPLSGTLVKLLLNLVPAHRL